MGYDAQVLRAIDYIECNIRDGEISIDGAAKAAGISRWHFQRIFGSMVGDTVMEYARKRRLTEALEALASTDDRVLDIALGHGFESQEAFTRSFQALFGITPGKARKGQAAQVQARRKPRITSEVIQHYSGGISMQPRFVDLPQLTVIGSCAKFISILSPEKTSHVVIPGLWNSFLKRMREVPTLPGWDTVGVCEPIANVTPDEFLYTAGTVVAPDCPVPSGMSRTMLPAGRYAVFTHKGTLDKLGHTMRYIYGSWAPKSGLGLREAPDFELYSERFRGGDNEESEIDLYIPVASSES